MDEIQFQWDFRKAAANQAKHGVSFEEARTVFADEKALLLADPDHSDVEDRFLLLGLSEHLRILVVAHTLREGGDVIRIISARRATGWEQRQYIERMLQ